MIRPDRPAPRPRVARRAPWLVALVALAAISYVLVSGRPQAGAITWSATAASDGVAVNEFDGISCTGFTKCVAVGYGTSPTGLKATLAKKWDGSAWTLTTTTNPGVRNNVLSGVSCTSVSSCTAVGNSDNGTTLKTLAERWNGTTWTTMLTANQSTTSSSFNSVSCFSTSCVAVGYSVNSSGNLLTLAERWNGTGWSLTSTPPQPNPDSVFSGVSCPTATTCVAVGYTVNSSGFRQALIATLTNNTWVLASAPNPNANNRLNSVSCTTTTSCVAVGQQDNAFGFGVTLVESLNGTTWSAQTSPTRPAQYNYLKSVSCWATGKCVAVGWNDNNGITNTVAMSSTGSAWALSTTPNPAPVSNELLATSCAGKAGCVAVGRTSDGTNEHVFALSGASQADTAAPTVTISRPADGAYYVVGESVPATYSCADEAGGSGVSSCTGTVASGAPFDTAAAGVKSFSATGIDYYGNSATTNASYTVVSPTSASLAAPPGGGTITTDPGGGPTQLAPVATTLTSVDEGALSINQQAVTLAPPVGLNVLGVQIAIGAPTANPSAPLTLTFDVDTAMLPNGTTIDSMSLIKGSALVPDCFGATTLPVGLDACITAQGDAPSGGGDLRMTAIAATAGQWNIATGTPGLPQLAAGNASATELDGTSTTTLQAPVTLNQPSALPVTVNYATANGTATAGSDYTSTSGMLTFPPGQTALTVPITIAGDNVHEPKETFALTLSSPTGATLGTPTGTETIVDNDPIVPNAPGVGAIGSSTHANVSWNAPTNGGSAVTGYLVQVYLGGVLQPSFTQTITCTQPCTPATAVIITGLTNDNTYTFGVSAQNVVGTGPQGTTTIYVNDISSGGYLAGQPATPGVTAGAGQITITWVAPVSGSGSIGSYNVVPIKAGIRQPPIPVGAGSLSYVYTGATPGVGYRFRVEAVNFWGPGAQSPPSANVIPT